MRLTNSRRRNVQVEQLEPKHLLATLGPELVVDLTTAPDSFVSTDVNRVGGTTLFVAGSKSTGSEFYTSDGTSEGTRLWSDLNPGAASSNPQDLQVSPDGRFAFFEATLGDRRAIWHTRGEEASPVMIRTLSHQVERVSILAVSNAGAYLTRQTDSEQTGIYDYVTDLWFADGETGAMRFVQTFRAEDDEGGITSAAVRDDGLLLFQHCLDEDFPCHVWGTDGTFQSTHRLVDYDVEDRSVREIAGELYFFDEYGIAQVYDGQSLSIAPEDPNLRDVTVSNEAGVLTYLDGELLLTNNANDTTVVVLDGLSDAPTLQATDSLFTALVNRDRQNQLWKFDPSNQQPELLQDFGRDWPNSIAANSQASYFTVITPSWRSASGGKFFPVSSAVWRTDGTQDGTFELAAASDAEFDGELFGEDLWLVTNSNDGRSLEIFRQDEVVATIQDRWQGTRGTDSFSLHSYGDQLVAQGKYDLWTTTPSFGEFTPIAVDDGVVDDVFVVGDRVVYTMFGNTALPNGKAVYANQGTRQSNIRLDDGSFRLEELAYFAGGRVLGDRLIFQTSNPPSLWTTDGTPPGTKKIFDLPRAVSDSLWRGEDGQVFFPSDHALTNWFVTDGTTEGTRLAGLEEVPDDTTNVYNSNSIEYGFDELAGVWVYSSAREASAVVGGQFGESFLNINSIQVGHDVFFTAWLRDEGYGLFRIVPGWDTPDSHSSPYVERYSELNLLSNTLESVGDDLVVFYDDGFHGAEPWRIPITHDLEFDEDYAVSEITCRHASDLQSRISFGETIPATHELIWYDVNADFELSADDLAEWARRVGAKGDVNVDGAIDAQDLNTIGVHWQQDVNRGWCDGDLNGDGTVNATDLNEVATRWPGFSPAGAAVSRAPRAPLAHRAQVTPVAHEEVETTSIRGVASLSIPNHRPTQPAAIDFVLARQSYRHRQVAEPQPLAESNVETTDQVFQSLRDNVLRRSRDF